MKGYVGTNRNRAISIALTELDSQEVTTKPPPELGGFVRFVLETNFEQQ